MMGLVFFYTCGIAANRRTGDDRFGIIAPRSSRGAMETSQAGDANRTFGHGSVVIGQDVVSLQGQASAL